jgi:hypothetical protein
MMSTQITPAKSWNNYQGLKQKREVERHQERRNVLQAELSRLEDIYKSCDNLDDYNEMDEAIVKVQAELNFVDVYLATQTLKISD